MRPNKKFGKKGFIYTLEVILAVAMISVFLVLIFSSAQAPVSARTALIKRQGFEALEFLEQTEELRELVFTENKVQLKKRIKDILPSGITVEADICRTSCRGNLPKNKTVVSLDYYVFGYRDTFFTRKAKIWMWGNL